jgi:hypothetical protein
MITCCREARDVAGPNQRYLLWSCPSVRTCRPASGSKWVGSLAPHSPAFIGGKPLGPIRRSAYDVDASALNERQSRAGPPLAWSPVCRWATRTWNSQRGGYPSFFLLLFGSGSGYRTLESWRSLSPIVPSRRQRIGLCRVGFLNPQECFPSVHNLSHLDAFSRSSVFRALGHLSFDTSLYHRRHFHSSFTPNSIFRLVALGRHRKE